MAASSWRREWLSKPLFRWAAKALPTMSDTEREAIEAGDVWWDADLFTGNPEWRRLLDMPPARLSDEERAFLDGPVAELCAMVDDWRVNWELHDLPPDIWAFLKARKFFGMIIPRKYGGLGFSAYAHSEVVRRISTRSLTAAVTVMVPNSLGPGELLLHFGTDAQREHWLPRLADGRDIPCFGLTSPEAGSDAAAMVDHGVVCKGMWQGREVLGMRLTWHKRYITLGPVATVLGLAFKLRDPDRLLGDREDIGITVALVPTDTPGVEIGRRHLPAMQVFQNGPNQGKDVFIPMEAVIGGVERVGQGWQMLMTALAAGRGISLPSLAAASCVFSAHTSGAYARVRQQFGIPIGKFEGVQEKLGRMAALAYQVDAARRLTCAALDAGHKPAVISAIMKYHATERMRIAVNDAMDIHAGKAVIDGPRNYLSNVYRAIPIGITVEGANILTRCLIVFGQGAIRAHPFLMREMAALADSDPARGLEEFDRTFWRHAGHATANALRAFGRAWTGGRFAPAPRSAGPVAPYYRALGRYASAFALVADVTLATLGGALKRKEMLSARLGDILAELYLLSAVLKRWHDEGRQPDDLPLVQWCMESGLAAIEASLDAVLANLPARAAAGVLRFVCLPRGVRRRGPADAVTLACAERLLEPSPARDRLLPGLARPRPGEALDRLAQAFDLAARAAPVLDELRHAGVRDWRDGVRAGKVDAAQALMFEDLERAIADVVEVDSFDPAELAGKRVAQG
ncbi:acyl-CoA dehydrogenase [Pigmentiphaga sp. GD03639]|uniref:acyl-CoA dehydrogenase n=1 Tax=Pigmentiphaga sp. GD03639 TaxID=2975354 RepID=UPI002449BA5A|nr:acyl-CoA dehydrogenase [Pigmentiphaga sp. GD03639]MDH2236648.1 acyl-CoA dehydrogenase [Pigmentiphaga sp. GD03639]